MIVPYRRSGTTYRSHLQGSLYAAYDSKRADLKIKLYGIVAVPDVFFGRENLSPQVKDITMSLFEDSVQRIIFRPRKGEVIEVRTLKEKFCNFYRPGDIINVIKYKRWTRHVEYMAAIRDACDGLIIRLEESYRLWRVVVCDQETS